MERFSNNKTPIEVAIELDLDPKDVEKIYLNYLGLTGLTQLVKIHQELGNYLPGFTIFYWSFIEAGADSKKIKEILDAAERLADFNLEIKNRQEERKNLEIQIQQKKQNLEYLDSQIEASNILSNYPDWLCYFLFLFPILVGNLYIILIFYLSQTNSDKKFKFIINPQTIK